MEIISTTTFFCPQEIIENILTRLPVKTLKRFSCVSKTWNLLIKHPRFVTSHLSRSLEISRHNPEIMITPFCRYRDFELSSDSKYPLQIRTCSASFILGSCDGLLLVCLQFLQKPTSILWNPATREYKKLPPSTVIHDQCDGFGYNPNLMDYEVLKITPIRQQTFSVVEIYSSKKNSWRRIQDIPYSIESLSECIVDGKLHLLAMHCSEVKYYCIIAYDFSAENFQDIPLPVTVDASKGSISISSVHGKLFLDVPFELGGVEGWVMNNCGLIESWTRLFKTTKLTNVPLFSTKEGEIVICTTMSRIVLCDPSDTGLNNTTELVTSKQLFEAKAYTPSLVSLGAGSETVKDTDSWAWCSVKKKYTSQNLE